MDSLYFAALQSFVVLAQTKRMQDAATQLGVSRQTIMRHVSHLEQLRGDVPLLSHAGHTYSLTQEGKDFFRRAQNILDQARSLAGRTGLSSDIVDGLERTRLITQSGHDYRSQQHPLWRVSEIGTVTIKKAFHIWQKANFDIGHPEVQELMPVLTIFRWQKFGWVCTHVGAESAYAHWVGKEWALSAVGCLQADAPAGRDYQVFASHAYESVLASGSCRYDHHYLELGKEAEHKFKFNLRHGTYQRLLMPFQLPDQTPVLVSLAMLTRQVSFADFEISHDAKMPIEMCPDDWQNQAMALELSKGGKNWRPMTH